MFCGTIYFGNCIRLHHNYLEAISVFYKFVLIVPKALDVMLEDCHEIIEHLNVPKPTQKQTVLLQAERHSFRQV